MTDVVLYSKPGCCLCDQAKAALQSAGTAFREVDITLDESLAKELAFVIPVVEVNGTPVFEAGMDPNDLPELVGEAPAP